MEHLIRQCQEQDLPMVVQLCEKHAHFEQKKFNKETKEQLLKDALFSISSKLFCYVIEVGKQVVGYFSYTFDFSTWDAKSFLYLDCLYLEPEFRGNRIGEKVFEILKEIAKHNGCVNIQWQTPVFNERAIKFYNKIGGVCEKKARFSMDLI